LIETVRQKITYEDQPEQIQVPPEMCESCTEEPIRWEMVVSKCWIFICSVWLF